MLTTHFVCGIDFGTTFTSVAFALSTAPKQVKLVQQWPESGNTNSADQVPTEILYLTAVDVPGKRYRWGYNIPSGGINLQEPLRWIKLLLQDQTSCDASGNFDQPLNLSLDGSYARKRKKISRSDGDFEEIYDKSLMTTPAGIAATKLDALGFEPIEAVADFLREVRTLSVSVMKNSFGANVFQDSRIEYVLTVPAIWTDAAKDNMIRAVTSAGYGTHRKDFNLVSEPEAAAAYTLENLIPEHSMKTGDNFVLCDAGGGTVDLITYEISGLKPLSVNESASGSGGLCGSVYLNHGFEVYMHQLLGKEVMNKMSVRNRTEMLRTWEEKVKFKFGKSSESFEVSVHGVPDNHAKNIEDGFHTISKKDVKDIFDPIVNKILELVRKQVFSVTTKGKKVSSIILIGGLGCSPYLFETLKTLKIGGNKPIEVLQPPFARTAIARGALQRGLDGSIVKVRRARRHYGVFCDVSYDPKVHGAEHIKHLRWSTAKDEYVVVDKMMHFVQKGKVVDDTFSQPLSFRRNIPVRSMDKNSLLTFDLEDKLYACDEDSAPDFKWMNPAVLYPVCKISTDFKKFPKNTFQRFSNQEGKEFYRINFDLKLSIQDEVTTFEILYQGRSYGLAITRFE